MLKFIDYNAILFSFPETTRPTITVRVPCYPLAQKPNESKPTTMTRQTDQAAVDRTARTGGRESQFRAIISVLPYQVHECGHCQYRILYLTNIY